MSVLFSAYEVGSVRSIYPILDLCDKSNISFCYTNIGFFKNNYNNDWDLFPVFKTQTEYEIKELLLKKRITSFIFSVNIKDTTALKIARVAKKLGITTIHILDYWNGYISRMGIDNKETFYPDYYIVPDDLARSRAISEGIPLEIILVLGQPAFEDSVERYELNKLIPKDNFLISKGLKLSGKLILFVSEPVYMDFGESKDDNQHYKGYTEFDVIPLVKKNLLKYNNIETCILPHPRESESKLRDLWYKDNTCNNCAIVSNIRGRDLLPFVDGVIGMASTLLYESWLMDIPVLSVQPGLIPENLRMLQKRKGVTFVDNKNNSNQIISKWLENICSNGNDIHRDHLVKERSLLHKNSANAILKLINREE